MKKSLLLLLIAGIWNASQAQNSAPSKQKFNTVSPVQLAQLRAKAHEAAGNQVAPHNSSQRVTKVAGEPTTLPFLGSSANTYGVLDATTTAVTANQATNLIVMTHRNNNTKITSCGTGAYIAAYSTDNGADWDTTVTLFCGPDNAADSGARYPNGVLFNPAGNTDPTQVYDAMAGPYTDGSATGDGWTSTVYGSISIGGANSNAIKWQNGAAGVTVQNNGDLSFMSSSDDSTVHVIGEDYKVNAAGDFLVWRGAVLTTGKFNPLTNAFTWKDTVFHPHIVPNFKGFTTTSPYDSDAAPLSVPGTAWSQDGKTGYVVILANLDSTGYNYSSNQPIVYKTTNSGKTWTMMPPFNFATIPSLASRLIPTQDSTSKVLPLWFTFETSGTPSQGATNSWDITVDYQGNLHIFSAIVSSFRASPDSSYEVSWYAAQDGYIYDVYTTTPTGGWQARFIDSMLTVPCHNVAQSGGNGDWDSTKSGSTVNLVGFGNRLQASRTTDGKHIFCTWEDDLTSFLPPFLVFPDVKGEAYSVPTNHAGPVHRFTSTTNNYYLCVSDIALTSGTGTDSSYTIPSTIVFPDEQQFTNDGTLPVNYFYLGTIVYNDTLGSTTAVQNIIPGAGFSIGPNYPNPFNNITRFNVNLTNQSVVAVDVYNLFGQKVYSIPAQQMSPGNHIMSIDGSTLSSGVYLYRVTSNGYAVTQKMVVEQ